MGRPRACRGAGATAAHRAAPCEAGARQMAAGLAGAVVGAATTCISREEASMAMAAALTAARRLAPTTSGTTRTPTATSRTTGMTDIPLLVSNVTLLLRKLNLWDDLVGLITCIVAGTRPTESRYLSSRGAGSVDYNRRYNRAVSVALLPMFYFRWL